MDLKEQKHKAVKAARQALCEGNPELARTYMREALRLHDLIYPDWRNSYSD